LSEVDQVKLISLNATAENGDALQIAPPGAGQLIGTLGDDVLVGTNINDFISGLAGNDTLTGGGGNDTFLFGPGFNQDVITDFTRAVGNRDMIDLTAFNFASSLEALSLAYADGANTVFDFGNNDYLIVENTAAGYITNLVADDFLI
jgi:Ca2+-binding RTX toxin-like protein